MNAVLNEAKPGRIRLNLARIQDPGKRAKTFWDDLIKDERTGCWNWAFHKNQDGYGRLNISGKVFSAHRVAWYFANGNTDPGNYLVLHKCDNPACCNPAHLFLGSDKDNMADMKGKGRLRRPTCEGHGRTNLTNAQVAEIKARWLAFRNATALEFGVSGAVVRNIITEKHWWRIEFRNKKSP